MKNSRVRRGVAFAAACAFVFLAAHAPADADGAYPNKTVRLIVPFAPGGAVDILSRVLAKSYGEQLKQTVIVENRPGANGNLAADTVAKAEPDGSTLLLGTNGTHATNAALYKRLTFDPVADFTPIGLAVTIPHVVVVNADLPVHSIAELIRYAKDNPGKLSFGSAGSGSSLHLAAELFDTMAGIKMLHVPYRGGALAVADLLADRTQVMFAVVPLVLQHIRAGKLRALAVTSSKRSTLLPDIPTISETVLPGYEAIAWVGILAPAKTPPDFVAKVNAATKQALGDKETRKLLELQGFEIVTGTPADFKGFIATETAKWTKVVRDSHVEIE